MGNIIYPACAQPNFLIPSRGTAFTCGSINLIIPAIIITIICLIILIFKFRKTTQDPTTKQEVKSINWVAIIVIFFIILLSWLLVPLFGWINARSWEGEQIRINAMIDASGGKITRADVIKQLQELYNKEQQARAIASIIHHSTDRRHGTGHLVGDLIRVI